MKPCVLQRKCLQLQGTYKDLEVPEASKPSGESRTGRVNHMHLDSTKLMMIIRVLKNVCGREILCRCHQVLVLFFLSPNIGKLMLLTWLKNMELFTWVNHTQSFRKEIWASTSWKPCCEFTSMKKLFDWSKANFSYWDTMWTTNEQEAKRINYSLGPALTLSPLNSPVLERSSKSKCWTIHSAPVDSQDLPMFQLEST